MNYSIIFRLLSIILGFIGLAFVFSLSIGFIYEGHTEEKKVILGFGLSIVIAWVVALFFYILGRKGNKKLYRREAFCIIGLGWIIASIVGALPYVLILDCSLVDAIFESTSGLTTTGATVFSQLDLLPRGLLFWRSLSQWIGGMGVIVFFVTLFSFPGAGAKILFSSESSLQPNDLYSSRVKNNIFYILYLYLGLSLLCLIAFRFSGMTSYEACCHMFTTIATGGFSIYDQSIGHFNSPQIEWFTILFMLLGATNFIFMIRLLQRDWKVLKTSTETLSLYLIIIFSTIVITIELFDKNDSSVLSELGQWGTVVRTSLFHVVSLMTSSGFSTTNYNDWPLVTHTILLGLMIIGGSSGSTAGGLKVIRFIAAIKIAIVHIESTFRSNVVRAVKINGQTLDSFAKSSILTYIVLTAFIGHLSLLIIAIMQPDLSIEGAFSVVIANFYNIGPGFQEVGPMATYASLKDISKYILCLLMIMGRLELYAILTLFLPSFWKRFS